MNTCKQSKRLKKTELRKADRTVGVNCNILLEIKDMHQIKKTVRLRNQIK